MNTPTEVQPLTRRAANIRERAEQRRLDDAAALDRRAREAELRLQERREKDDLKREGRAVRAQEKAERKAARSQARAALAAWLDELAPTIGRRVLIAGPILAPMAVAWIGQLGFATDTLDWPLIGGLVFAAAWELSTAFNGWMYHQARQDGDSGTVFRVATWLFASAAGLMNYWHALPKGGHLDEPTPKAASFGVMSLSGIALWELYTLLIHRKKLRADGKLPPVRPRFGLARWTQFPRTTWVARSLSIRDGHTTVDAAWTAALAELDRRTREGSTRKAAKRAAKLAQAAAKAGRRPVHITVVRGPRTELSTAPLRTWSQPPIIWVPAVGRPGVSLDLSRTAGPGRFQTVPGPVPAIVERRPWDRVWDRLGEAVPDGLTPEQLCMAYGLARRHFEQVGRHISADTLRSPLGTRKAKALGVTRLLKGAYETEVAARFPHASGGPDVNDDAPLSAETTPEPAGTPALNSGPAAARSDA